MRRQISTAENTFHNSFHPGYAGASAVRGSGFHAVALNEHFGYGSDAFDYLEAVLHEGDKLRIDEPGERFRHAIRLCRVANSGARDWSRTSTRLPSLGPEPSASTSSATRARGRD